MFSGSFMSCVSTFLVQFVPRALLHQISNQCDAKYVPERVTLLKSKLWKCGSVVSVGPSNAKE